MIKFLKKIAAAPTRALARLLGFGNFLDTTALWAIVFKLNPQGDDGSILLQKIYFKYGLDEARNTAVKIISASKSAKPAAVMASIEFQNGNIDDANRWIKLADEKNCEDPEFILLTKLYMSEFYPEYDKKHIIDQILSINYLPMEITRIALIEKSFTALEDKDLQLSGQIADRILTVEENYAARIVKAAIAIANKNLDQAEKLLIKAQEKITPAQFYPLASHALICVGHTEMAMEYLCRAGKLNDNLVRSNTLVGSLARSQEFADYCSRRKQKST